MTLPLGGMVPEDGYYFWLANAVDGTPMILRNTGVVIDGKTLYELVPLYQGITLPLIASTIVLYPPAMPETNIGPLATISSGSALYPPTVVPDLAVTLAFIAAGSQLFVPTIANTQLVTLGTIASGSQLYAISIVGFVDLAFISSGSVLYQPKLPFEPWGEVGRQETIVSGALTLDGLDLSGFTALRLYLNGIRVTSDDSIIRLRLIIGGSEISTGYDWGHNNVSAGGRALVSGAADTSVALVSTTATAGVGNDATESFSGIVTLWMPNGSQPKGFSYSGDYIRPSGAILNTAIGTGVLPSETGVVTGFKLFGSSDLVAGSLILLGVE